MKGKKRGSPSRPSIRREEKKEKRDKWAPTTATQEKRDLILESRSGGGKEEKARLSSLPSAKARKKVKARCHSSAMTAEEERGKQGKRPSEPNE